MRSASLPPLILWLGALVLLGCKPTGERPAQPVPAAVPNPLATESAKPAAAPTQDPPSFAFVPPQPWQSSRKGSRPLPPPNMSEETWRIMVTQKEPLQAKTPLWQELPADRTVELQMAPGSRWRCSSSPLVVQPQADDFNIKLSGWELTRTLRCSSDGWHTWSEYTHAARVLPDGKHEMGPAGSALLRERAADKSVIETVLVLRSDKHIVAATTGHPRILAGVHVDDD
jgi:hypothetical protein